MVAPERWVATRPRIHERDEQESYWAELGRQRLAGEVSKSDAGALALTYIKRIAQRIVASQADPLRGALDIYSFAWLGGGWDDDQPVEELQRWGAEFIQLHEALERNYDDDDITRKLGRLYPQGGCRWFSW